jgi:DNA-binding response OmpR family regulator
VGQGLPWLSELLARAHSLSRKVEAEMQQYFGDSDPGGSPANRRHTVLVVEDDESTRSALASWLTSQGFVVLTAGSGYEAIQHLLHPLEPIEAVILDVGLPDVDGVTLHETIRDICPGLPVVICTGEATTDQAARMLELGARRYLRKPVEPEELVSAVADSLP